MPWQRIPDDDIIHYWICEEHNNEKAEVSPRFYEKNGTPTCPCGADMVYCYTEVNIPERNDS